MNRTYAAFLVALMTACVMLGYGPLLGLSILLLVNFAELNRKKA